MIIVCPACSARFQYDDERFKGVASKHFKCTKCENVFEFWNPMMEGQGAAPKQTPKAPKDPPASHARTGAAARTPTAAPGRGGVQLVYLSGPKASMALELTSPRTVIGRDEGDVITKDPETSKRHAMIEVMGDGTVWLSDLGSKNGTFTEGSPVTGRVQLADGQEFTCGRSVFMIRMA